jgi:hypothetical protein
VLERMHLYTTTNIGELLPQNWKNTKINNPVIPLHP